MPTSYNQISGTEFETSQTNFSYDLLISSEFKISNNFYFEYGLGMQSRSSNKEFIFGEGILNEKLAFFPLKVNYKRKVNDKLHFNYGVGIGLTSPISQKISFSQNTILPTGFIKDYNDKSFYKFSFIASIGTQYSIHENLDFTINLNGNSDIKSLTINNNNNPEAYYKSSSISVGLKYFFKK
jgi:opacity protein-like surface antigen